MTITDAHYELLDCLNKFLVQFGELSTNWASAFMYEDSTETIYISNEIPYDDHKAFINFVTNELCTPVKADCFLWAFLHELGHYHTIYTFEEKDWEDYYFLIHNCKDPYEYYRCPVELAATRWAENYMIEHREEVYELWNDVSIILQKIYKQEELDALKNLGGEEL